MHLTDILPRHIEEWVLFHEPYFDAHPTLQARRCAFTCRFCKLLTPLPLFRESPLHPFVITLHFYSALLGLALDALLQHHTLHACTSHLCTVHHRLVISPVYHSLCGGALFGIYLPPLSRGLCVRVWVGSSNELSELDPFSDAPLSTMSRTVAVLDGVLAVR